MITASALRRGVTAGTLLLAGATVLAACTSGTGDSGAASPSSSASTGASAEASPAAAEVPGVSTTHGALVPDFPATIEQYPDSTIVRSSVSDSSAPAADPSASAAPAPEASAPAANVPAGMVNASLVFSVAAGPDEIIDFYTTSLEGKGFSAVGDTSWAGGVASRAFHKADDGQTVSVSVSGDPETEGNHLATVGGVVVP